MSALRLAISVLAAVQAIPQMVEPKAVLRPAYMQNGAYLQVGTRITGVDPTEENNVLVLVARGSKAPITSMNSLRGRVRVRDRTAALQFVRLVSEERTFRAFPRRSRMREIRTDTRLFRGRLGLISPNLYRRLRLTAPRVRPLPDGFEVKRWVVRYDRAEEPVGCLAIERVTHDGGYSIRCVRPLRVKNLYKSYSDPDAVEWTIETPIL